MKVALIYSCDDFIKEIEEDLRSKHEVRTFFYTKKQVKFYDIPSIVIRLKKLMKWADVCFFEWSTFLLAIASRLRKPRNTRIVTRLHKFEIYSWMDRIKWYFVDRVIFVGESTRQRFMGLAQGKIHNYKLYTVRNFVDATLVNPPKNC